MNKEIKFKLTNKTLPLLPYIHGEVLEDIKMEGDKLILSCSLSGSKGYINSVVDFDANRLTISTNLLDDADCDIEISKTFHKKMLKERSKLGYGKKSNIYAIRDFLKIYKGYPLYFARTMVGVEKVHIVFEGKAGVEARLMINCKEITYTFSE
ncbi:MAG: hypothetical protein E7379_03455 [Clostridiales bacterium]|nr:hypothetical protein [Clostridiales bacterium]